MIVVCRGRHCPIRARPLTRRKDRIADVAGQGVDVVAISADSAERADVQLGAIVPKCPMGDDLSVPRTEALGRSVSDPRSAQESDRPFPELGLFNGNADGNLQIADPANACPIRGTQA